MPVDSYTVELLDPFGQSICGMTYHSFAPDDEAMNWFSPLLDGQSEKRINLNEGISFSVRIRKNP